MVGNSLFLFLERRGEYFAVVERVYFTKLRKTPSELRKMPSELRKMPSELRKIPSELRMLRI